MRERPDFGKGHGTNSASVVDVFDPVNLCVNITANKGILSIVSLLVLKTTTVGIPRNNILRSVLYGRVPDNILRSVLGLVVCQC